MKRLLALIALAVAPAAPAAVPGVYSANGTFVGRLMDVDASGRPGIASPQGYYARFETSGIVARADALSPTFLSANCSGVEYFFEVMRGQVVARLPSNLLQRKVLMFRPDRAGTVVPAGTVTSRLVATANGEVCQNNGPLPSSSVFDAGETNDPSVTGIADRGPGESPLSVRMLFGDWTRGELFESSFEAGVPAYRGD